MPVTNVTDQPITETLEKNYMPYVMSVILSRAIPEIDGFKPSHRKLLYTMYKMGLLTGNRIKSADVVGQTMRLNPHGESAIYETLVRLTRGYDALLLPFIDSKGNFGKQYSRDMAYAASRYTEVKLAPVCGEIFQDIDKDTVDFIENYNGTTKEPLLLPTSFPNLLVTANQGIAVGMASSIPGFNLKEVTDATIAYIKNKNCDLIKYLPAPDFSTGGQIIYNKKEIENIYETGRGGVKLRAKYRYDKKSGVIEINEIPYTTTAEAIIDKIASLVKSGKIKDITDVRDETDLHGLKIAIDIRKSANPDHIMHRLFSLTTLSDSFSCNFNVLIDGRPRTMGIKEILEEWVVFRIGCVSRRIKHDLARKKERLHLLDGLAKILLDIDRAIRIIRHTKEEKNVIPNLMEGFKIDAVQAEFIAEIRLRNLNEEYILRQTTETENIKKEIGELEDILDSEERINEIIISQLREAAKKYGAPRRTEIVYEDLIPEIDPGEFVEDYQVRVFLTAKNYFKKISFASLRMSGEQYVQDGDSILQSFETTNRAELIFFSDRQNAYKTRIHELPDSKAASLGDYLNNLLSLEADEQILFMAATTDYSGDIIFIFENGKAARVSLGGYSTKQNRRRLVNAYSCASRLVYAAHVADDTDLLLIRDSDKAMMFNTSLLETKISKASSGIQAYKLSKQKSKVTKVFSAGELGLNDADYYRTNKIPSSGHFIKPADLKIINETRFPVLP